MPNPQLLDLIPFRLDPNLVNIHFLGQKKAPKKVEAKLNVFTTE